MGFVAHKFMRDSDQVGDESTAQTAPRFAGGGDLSIEGTWFGVLETVVRRFSRNDNVMGMRFPQAGCGDADEFGLRPQSRDVANPAVPHSAPQPAHHLENLVGTRP